MYRGGGGIEDNEFISLVIYLCVDNYKIKTGIIVVGQIHLFWKEWTCPLLTNIGKFNIVLQTLCELQLKQFQFDPFANFLKEKIYTYVVKLTVQD